MLLAGSTAAEAPHRASRGHAPVSLVGTSQRDSNALRTQRSAAPSRARAVGGPGADLLRGKRGAPTKSVDLRNWLGCNGRSVWLEAALASPGPYFRILTFSTVFFRYIQLASSGVVPGVPWDSHRELIVCIFSSQTNFLSINPEFYIPCLQLLHVMSASRKPGTGGVGNPRGLTPRRPGPGSARGRGSPRQGRARGRPTLPGAGRLTFVTRFNVFLPPTRRYNAAAL